MVIVKNKGRVIASLLKIHFLVEGYINVLPGEAPILKADHPATWMGVLLRTSVALEYVPRQWGDRGLYVKRTVVSKNHIRLLVQPRF